MVKSRSAYAGAAFFMANGLKGMVVDAAESALVSRPSSADLASGVLPPKTRLGVADMSKATASQSLPKQCSADVASDVLPPKAVHGAAGPDMPKVGKLVEESAATWAAPRKAAPGLGGLLPSCLDSITNAAAMQRSDSGMVRGKTSRANSITSSSSLTDLKKSKKTSRSNSVASITSQSGTKKMHSCNVRAKQVQSTARLGESSLSLDMSKVGRAGSVKHSRSSSVSSSGSHLGPKEDHAVHDDAHSGRPDSICSDASQAAGKKLGVRSNSGSRLSTPTSAGQRRVGTTCFRKHNPKNTSMYSDARNAFGCLQDYNDAAALKTIAFMDHAEINTKDWLGRTLLHYAAAKGCIAVVQELLANERFHSINALDSMSRSALVAAAETGHSEICTALLDCPAFEQAEAKDIKGWTALHYASAVGHVEVIDCLLDHPAYKAAGVHQERGWTPLHCAFLHAHGDTIGKLQARTKMTVTSDTHTDVMSGVRASQAKQAARYAEEKLATEDALDRAHAERLAAAEEEEQKRLLQAAEEDSETHESSAAADSAQSRASRADSELGSLLASISKPAEAALA